MSEFLNSAILGLQSPHKKGRLVMVRLREKAEKKRESSLSARAWGALPGFSDRRRRRRIEGRKAHYERETATGLEDGRTDEVYTKVVGEGRQAGRQKHSR